MTEESGSGDEQSVQRGHPATVPEEIDGRPDEAESGRADGVDGSRSDATGLPAADAEDPQADDGQVRRCDYCRQPIPATALQFERDDVTYRFCSEACRDALAEQEAVFTEYHGHRRLSAGVSVLDASLPQGIPRNSFVSLSEVAGSRVEAVQAELAWRALQRGEPVVFVTYLEPPVSLVQSFVDMEWNVLPSLERGDLQIVDCFSYRVEDRDRMYERMNDWNRHLWDVASDATTTVRDPSDMSELHNRIDTVLEDADMQDRGIVVLDSLVELGSLVQPIQAYDAVKDLRADVCKGRFVPIFAGTTVSQDREGFPHDLEYMVDGVVELRLTEELVENALIKQLRVRKMSGVLSYPQWQVFEYTSGAGAVGFDPIAQQAQNEGASDGAPPAEPGGANQTKGEAGGGPSGSGPTQGGTGQGQGGGPAESDQAPSPGNDPSERGSGG